MKISQSSLRIAGIAMLLLAFAAFPASVFAQNDTAPVTAAQPEAAPATAPAVAPAPDFYAIAFTDAPEAAQAAISLAETAALAGQWLTAWNGLAEFDPDNADPFVLAEKIRLALDGYAQTAMHKAFGFVDLTEGQDLDSIRYGMENAIDLTDFDPEALVAALEAKGEAMPPVLSLALGDYYFDVWQQYENQWVEDSGTVLTKAAEAYDRALAYDAVTPRSLDRQSRVLYELQRYDGAETVLNKALELDPNSNVLMIRLADVYLNAGRGPDALPYVDRILANSPDDQELNDAYVIGIRVGLDENDKAVIDKYVDAYEASFPGDSTPGLVRHLAAVQMGDSAAADAAADQVTASFPGDPNVIRTLLTTWLSAQDIESGFRYLDRAIATQPGDDAMAALYFYRALLNYEASSSSESLAKAVADITMAEEYFKKSYPEGHDVFGLITETRNEWNAAIAAAAESAATPPADADATSAASEESESYEAAPAAEPTTTTTVPPAAPAPAYTDPAVGGSSEADSTSAASE